MAIGKAKIINKNFVKHGSTIIDVGINRIQKGLKNKIVGDTNYDDIVEKVGKITPVPGGVGPMTVACLMYNTVKANFIRSKLEFAESIFDE